MSNDLKNMKIASPARTSVNWLLLFILLNCALLGGSMWLVQRKIDEYAVPAESLLGSKKGESFIFPLGLKQEEGAFLQLAHEPTNTKVSLFMRPIESSTTFSDGGYERDIERVFQALRTYKPGVSHSVQSDIFAFLRGQFDTRRALLQEVIIIEGLRFLRVLVNKKDHYIIGLMSRKDEQVAIVAFNPDNPVLPEVIKSLFNEYPEFYEKWRVES
jgi:hypothetical protein